jgi:hypothetical protein
MAFQLGRTGEARRGGTQSRRRQGYADPRGVAVTYTAKQLVDLVDELPFDAGGGLAGILCTVLSRTPHDDGG